ncbi:MAG: 16S rRNA (guanine(966)-N(2))-methyltransferase RsmD [Lachnospiraceae bacterium]|nr:16S rRNA (guanine(966)-N(2))-methyltransferase RsmD [Lachnospiraceae bacterium]
MRVIAGSAKRTQLITPKGMETRPTTDRIKETLFNILSPCLWEARFLDLFAGSGGIGIEALSRGAAEAVFVDQNRESVSCIRENLRRTHLEDRAQVLGTSVNRAVSGLSAEGHSFDLIFMDPPYRKGLEIASLKLLRDTCLLHGDTLLILEMALDDPLGDADVAGYKVERVAEYKTNRHVFLRPVVGES